MMFGYSEGKTKSNHSQCEYHFIKNRNTSSQETEHKGKKHSTKSRIYYTVQTWARRVMNIENKLKNKDKIEIL